MLALIAALGIVAGAVKAQVPTDGASPPGAAATSNQDLEKRVRELELLVQKLQANASVQPASLSTQPTTQPATLQPPVEGTPVPSEMPFMAQPDGHAFGSGGIGAIGGATYTSPYPISDPQPHVPFGLPEGQIAGWNNGFFIQSPDREFIMRFTGQIQTDYRGYLKSADTTDIDEFLLRRARFGVESNIFQFYEFRFLEDFGQGKTVIQDCYMNVHYWDAFQFEVGKFKQPVSYEQLIIDRWVPTLERSMIDQFVPARDEGVMFHGENLIGNRLDYAIGVFNGETNGDADTNNSSDVAARVVTRPFAGDAMPIWLQHIQFGASGTFGQENEAMVPNPLRTPATVPFLTWTSGDKAYGTRTRFIPEYSYFCGPFGFYAEYLIMEQEIQGPAAKSKVQDIPINGYVLFSSLLLTGETRTTYNEQIRPLAPFDPRNPFHNPGAWELIARTSQVHVGDQVFAAGANQLVSPTAGFANQATEFTVGFNWYWNAWVRVQFNAEHDVFDDPVLLGATRPSGLLKSQNSLNTRFQIIF
jgi:phosphate-selective porin OprO and OprP